MHDCSKLSLLTRVDKLSDQLSDKVDVVETGMSSSGSPMTSFNASSKPVVRGDLFDKGTAEADSTMTRGGFRGVLASSNIVVATLSTIGFDDTP